MLCNIGLQKEYILLYISFLLFPPSLKMPMEKSYNAQEREEYWTKKWVEDKLYQTPDISGDADRENNEYVLDMFPYPSGSGLHVGHPMGYVGTDIYSRMRRMQGKNVLHPMGYDAFGLPAEQYAIETGNHPSTVVNAAIESFRTVMQRLGLSYDWDREVNTADPDYYKWTQWIFTKLYERGLATYEDTEVMWCPALGTVLANDEIEEDGTSKRGGHQTELRSMKQWVLKITEYADRLLEDLDQLDWPENIKEAQRNHIGRSEGLEISFDLQGQNLEVFTTHAETLYGVTFIVLSTSHPFISSIVAQEKKETIDSYIRASANLSDRERMTKEKTGVFTGAHATHPITGEPIEIWVADYVKAGYAKGAVMGVPTGDERDQEFAEKYSIASKEIYKDGIYAKKKGDPEGQLINSGILDGLSEEEARKKMAEFAETSGFAKKTVNYHIHDWIFSRQRFWGEPFPVIHHPDGSMGILDVSQLPLRLPELTDFKPVPSENPVKVLDRATDWVETPEGKRETNTMPGAAGSSWYFLRYIDPKNQNVLADFEKMKAWLPVDQYVGGSEHTTGHVLYARFWHKVLFDAGVVPTSEPFKRLTNQGLLHGEDGEKMSKSKGNTVPVKNAIEEHGADALRVYEMFMGPFDKSKRWDADGIKGATRWLENIMTVVQRVDANTQIDSDLMRDLHTCIKKVTDDTAAFKFNTAIAAMMDLVNNKLKRLPSISPELATILCKLIAPYAPMLAEEIWCNVLTQEYSVHKSEWPEYNETLATLQVVKIAVQINGKVRTTIDVDSANATNEEVVAELARTSEKIAKSLVDKNVQQYFVPGRLINFVIGKE